MECISSVIDISRNMCWVLMFTIVFVCILHTITLELGRIGDNRLEVTGDEFRVQFSQFSALRGSPLLFYVLIFKFSFVLIKNKRSNLSGMVCKVSSSLTPVWGIEPKNEVASLYWSLSLALFSLLKFLQGFSKLPVLSWNLVFTLRRPSVWDSLASASRESRINVLYHHVLQFINVTVKYCKSWTVCNRIIVLI